MDARDSRVTSAVRPFSLRNPQTKHPSLRSPAARPGHAATTPRATGARSAKGGSDRFSRRRLLLKKRTRERRNLEQTRSVICRRACEELGLAEPQLGWR